MFHHPEFGEVQFEKIYFEIEKPVLFISTFEKTDEKYVGIMVEEYDHPFAENMRFFIYYFAGVAENEIRHLEKTKGSLKELYENRPVWFLQHRDDMGATDDRWEKHHSINPIYEITEKASLN